jgi:hypothetical protein
MTLCAWMTSRKWLNEAKQKVFNLNILTRSFASQFFLRYEQPFFENFDLTTNWSLSPQGLTAQKQIKMLKIDNFSDYRGS